MPKLTWLAGYSGQTVDQLLALEGTHRIDSLVSAFEQALEQKAAREGTQSLTDEERVVLAVEALEREVNNDGYVGFFENSSREFTLLIAHALRRIGCPRTADITEKAVQALGLPQLTTEAVEEAMYSDDAERDELLAQCDAQYYQSPENIEEQLFAFIKANRGRIRP